MEEENTTPVLAFDFDKKALVIKIDTEGLDVDFFKEIFCEMNIKSDIEGDYIVIQENTNDATENTFRRVYKLFMMINTVSSSKIYANALKGLEKELFDEEMEDSIKSIANFAKIGKI